MNQHGNGARIKTQVVRGHTRVIGFAQKGISSNQLSWESGKASVLSLEMGSFKCLYIPGLISG